MKTLFVIGLIIVGIIYLLRYLRQREVNAFLDTDMMDFQTFDLQQKKEQKTPDPLMARAEAYAAVHPGVVKLKRNEAAPGEELPTYVPDPTLYVLKEQVFDEVTRNMLVNLVDIVPESVCVLFDVPLSEFVYAEKDENAAHRLSTNRIAFLLCNRDDLSVICGVQLKGNGATAHGPDFVKSVFSDIGRPLLEFPLSGDISEFEIRDRLDPVLLSREKRICPKCGESMNVRKAVKGRNAGDVFWVCRRFPACRGVVRA